MTEVRRHAFGRHGGEVALLHDVPHETGDDGFVAGDFTRGGGLVRLVRPADRTQPFAAGVVHLSIRP